MRTPGVCCVTAPPPEQEIRALLPAYESAYESLSAAAVARILPSAPAGLERAFGGLKSLRMDVEEISPPTIQGATATAICRVRQRVEPKVGKATETVRDVTFQFRKVGNAWQIVKAE